MTKEDALRLRARAEAARGGMAIDLAAYEAAGRDPLEPLLGGGDARAAVGFFGRDPGRDEVRHHAPLIGAGGRLVRDGVHRALFGCTAPDFSALYEMNRHAFFSNTVPYKPVGNKPWSAAVIDRFRPIIAEFLAEVWQGEHLVTLGNDAFLWFGEAAEAWWDRPDRYEASLTVSWPRRITLHPLPHPSPANATWHQRFPAMLDARLAALGFGREARAAAP